MDRAFMRRSMANALLLFANTASSLSSSSACSKKYGVPRDGGGGGEEAYEDGREDLVHLCNSRSVLCLIQGQEVRGGCASHLQLVVLQRESRFISRYFSSVRNVIQASCHATVYATFTVRVWGDAEAIGRRHPTMDGSAPVSVCLRAYDGREESRGSCDSSAGRSPCRGRHQGGLDRIGKKAYKSLGRGEQVSNLIKIFDNQTTIYDPGAHPTSVPTQAMALVGGGGDYGGTGEGPAHPKPSMGVEAVQGREERYLAIMGADEAIDSNWDGVAAAGQNVGPEARISGTEVLEDEFCMEEEEEEAAPPVAPVVWRMMARYYSLKAANFTLIHEHFSEVWRIRGKMIFKPLKDNFFIITFNREGDYKFVKQGGPWIHQGVACLVAPLDDSAQPSEAVLDSVRLWVRFYNVAWKKQTKEYGELIGSKLGKVVEVDVDDEGLELSEYLRVRIDWPLNQRLLARFKTTIKGQPSPKIYHMRYERVPYFCFYCGFIGHNEDQCEQKDRGIPSMMYDTTLRCSPKRKFQSRAIATPDEPAPKRSLRFTSPEGSVNSSSLGLPPKLGRAAGTANVTATTEIPVAVDAHDGFEEEDARKTDAVVETVLANTVHNLQLKMSSDKAAMAHQGTGRGNNIIPGTSQPVKGGSSNTVKVVLAPNAMDLMKNMVTKSGSQDVVSGPHSSDMIPPLKGLSQIDISGGSGSDVSMTDADSLLGKRSAEDNQKLDLSLTLNCSVPAGRKQKKGRKTGDAEASGEKRDTATDSVAARTRRRIATGHVTPGDLTRPNEGSRQEQ